MPKPITVADYRLAAKRYLPRAVFDYVDGAAGDERGLKRNREAIERILVWPRPLRDVSRRDASVEVLGKRQDMPVVVGPVGLPGSVRPGADVALARAARRAGVPFALSTAASASIEEVRAASDGDLWFQLYVLNRGLAEGLVKRALAADYSTLVLTVDTAVGGRRERDTRNGFGIPFRMTPRLRAASRLGEQPAAQRPAGIRQPEERRSLRHQPAGHADAAPDRRQLCLGRFEGAARRVAAQARGQGPDAS